MDELIVELHRANRVQAIVVYILFTALTGVNFYYLKTRVLALDNKQFHLMMFVILQLSYVCCIVAEISY